MWVCEVCRVGVVSVDVREADGSLQRIGWDHARRVDPAHSPKPVPLSEVPGQDIRTVCDICGEPDPKHAWRTSSGEHISAGFLGSRARVEFRDRDNLWLVCVDCIPLIRDEDVAALLRRRLAHPFPGLDRKVTMAERTWIFERIRGFVETREGEPFDRPF